MNLARRRLAALLTVAALTACDAPATQDALADLAEADLAERIRLVEQYGGDDGPLDAVQSTGKLAGRPAECGVQDDPSTGKLEKAIRIGKTTAAQSDDHRSPEEFEALWRRAGCAN